MNIHGKPYAPRPIRKVCNFSIPKHENGFNSGVSSTNNSPLTNNISDSSKGKIEIVNFGFDMEKNKNIFQMFNEIEKLDKIENFINNTELEFEFENDVSNEDAKSEILKILKKKDSKNFIHFFNDNYSNTTYATTIISESDNCIRNSMPTLTRADNPLYKNFSSDNSFDNGLDLIKYNSGQLFKKINK